LGFFGLLSAVFLVSAIYGFIKMKRAKKENNNENRKQYFIVFIIFLFLFLLTSCAAGSLNNDNSHENTSKKEEKSKSKDSDDSDSDKSKDSDDSDSDKSKDSDDSDSDKDSKSNNRISSGLVPGEKVDSATLEKNNEEKQGSYYSDNETDPETRIFVDNNMIITKVQILFEEEAVESKDAMFYVSTLLDDYDLKRTDSHKDSTDFKFSPGEKINFYSPKYKAWFNMSTDALDNKHISGLSFSRTANEKS